MSLADNLTEEQSTRSWPGCLVLAVVLSAGSWGCSSHESGALEEVSDLVPMGGEMKEEVKGKEEIGYMSFLRVLV